MNTLRHARPAIDVPAALWAGLVAGAAFMMLEMLMVSVFLGHSPWAPPRMIAAMAMGREVLPPPATFDMGIMVVAMAIHFVLSIVLAFVFALVARDRPLGKAVLLGALFGLVVYAFNFYVMTAVFPWFADARNWVSVVAHLVFGAALGVVYATRAGVHARTASQVA